MNRGADLPERAVNRTVTLAADGVGAGAGVAAVLDGSGEALAGVGARVASHTWMVNRA